MRGRWLEWLEKIEKKKKIQINIENWIQYDCVYAICVSVSHQCQWNTFQLEIKLLPGWWKWIERKYGNMVGANFNVFRKDKMRMASIRICNKILAYELISTDSHTWWSHSISFSITGWWHLLWWHISRYCCIGRLWLRSFGWMCCTPISLHVEIDDKRMNKLFQS